MATEHEPKYQTHKQAWGKTIPRLARLPASLALALTLGLVTLTNPPSNSVAASDCTFKLGFKALAEQIPQIVGNCLTDEVYNPQNGDSTQMTEKGMLVWRKADNFTAFTDGNQTWINGPYGLATRLNTQRFVWENDPTQPPVTPLVPEMTLTQINTDQKLVALTLDSGQGRFGTGEHMTEEQKNNIIAMLNIIRRNGAQATFFGTGALYEDEGNRKVIETVIEGGNEFANHTYDHKDAKQMSLKEFLDQLHRTEDILRSKYNQSTLPWFRYPFLSAYYTDTLAQNGYYNVWMTGSCESGDWLPGATAKIVYDKLTAPQCMKPGTILLAHAYTSQTREALDRVLKTFQAQGFRVTTISEVWQHRN